MGVIAVVMLASVGVRLFFGYQVQRTKSEQDRLKREVASKQEVERSYVIFSNKLKMLQEIVSGRADKQAAIAFFTQAFGPEVLLKEISYEASDRKVSFRLQTDTVFSLERVVALLDSPEVRATYPKLERDELRRSNTGTYEVGVIVSLVSKDPKTK